MGADSTESLVFWKPACQKFWSCTVRTTAGNAKTTGTGAKLTPPRLFPRFSCVLVTLAVWTLPYTLMKPFTQIWLSLSLSLSLSGFEVAETSVTHAPCHHLQRRPPCWTFYVAGDLETTPRAKLFCLCLHDKTPRPLELLAQQETAMRR